MTQYYFQYSPAVDAFWCVNGTTDLLYQSLLNGSTTIPISWITEAQLLIPMLQNAWDVRGNVLLSTAAKAVGRSFDRKEDSLNLYLCPNINGANALPALFPLWPYLRSAIPDDSYRWPYDWFTNWYVFHEVLHQYVANTIDYTKSTQLLTYYYYQLIEDPQFTHNADNIALVLTHLHLNAIRLVVFGEQYLNEPHTMQLILDREMNSPFAHISYVKAWKIILSLNMTEVQAFLNEVKGPNY